MTGVYFIYKMNDWYMEHGVVDYPDTEPRYPVLPGYTKAWISWQPGIAFHMWGTSNIFIGLSIGPTFGLHAGVTL